MAPVNEGSHSFTCHPHFYPQVKYLLLLPSRRASLHFGCMVLIFRPAEGRRLSWPGWL